MWRDNLSGRLSKSIRKIIVLTLKKAIRRDALLENVTVRPLFATHNLRLEEVTIHTGESALKECSNIEVADCRFEGKYPFWHTDGFRVENCLFTEGARAALWYSKNLHMMSTLVEAPKMFREMDGMKLEDVLGWHSRNLRLVNCKISGTQPLCYATMLDNYVPSIYSLKVGCSKNRRKILVSENLRSAKVSGIFSYAP